MKLKLNYQFVQATALLAVASCVSAQSVTPPDAGAIQKQIEKQLPSINLLPVPGPEFVAPKVIRPEKADVKVIVKAFRIEGASSVSEAEIQAVLSVWIGKELSMAELQDAADAVARLFSDKGLLVRAFFPPQEIKSDGVVVLKIIEAKFGGVKFDENRTVRTNRERIAKYIYAVNQPGDLINTKKIEAVIFLLEELPGVDVKTEIQPGEVEGVANLYISLMDKPLITGSVVGSNFGNTSTGNEQGLLNLNLNNFFGYGDLFSVNALANQGTTYGKVAWYAPIGYDGLKVGLNYSAMDYSTVSSFSGYKGKSSSVGTNLIYPLLRSAATNINSSLSFDSKSYSNSAENSGLVISEYDVKAISAGISGNHYDTIGLGGVTYGSVSVTQGTWKNKVNDASTTYGQFNPKTFKKLNLVLTRNQQLIDNQTILSLAFSSQWSSVNLDSVEKFYLGGPNGVRAYPSAQGSGDNGAMINIELQRQLKPNIVGYLFFDAGQVTQYKNAATYAQVTAPNTTNAANEYSLSGAGLGVRYRWDMVDINGSVAWPIGSNPLYSYSSANNGFVQKNNDGKSGDPYIWLQATYSF